MGVSIFSRPNGKEVDTNVSGAAKRTLEDIGTPIENEYQVRMFNFTMLNTCDFTASPSSMTFLAQHGFDFNKLFLQA
eukprot:gene11580-13515_t